MACASARMPKPDVFSERKSSSMMTMGNESAASASLESAKKSAKCRADSTLDTLPQAAPREGDDLDWNPPTLWWLAPGALVAAELATGTFYLLMVALGCAAGALAAHAGLSGTTQVVCAALLGLVATAAWHLHRARQPGALPVQHNRDVNLDIGSPFVSANGRPTALPACHTGCHLVGPFSPAVAPRCPASTSSSLCKAASCALRRPRLTSESHAWKLHLSGQSSR
jgi:hypothetical protein